MHPSVSSRVTYHHIINWKNSLKQDISDPFAYWIRYFHHEPDGKELADAILCALQEVSHCCYCYLELVTHRVSDA